MKKRIVLTLLVIAIVMSACKSTQIVKLYEKGQEVFSETKSIIKNQIVGVKPAKLVLKSENDLKENSKAYIVVDYDTGETLMEHNADEVRAIASISKLMSYLLVEEAIKKGEIRPDDVITGQPEDVRGGTSFGLSPDREYSISQLLEGMIVVSGNDTAACLGRIVGGSEKDFASKMNNRANELELDTAHFINASGLSEGDDEMQNEMSARDVARLARYIIKNYPEILELSSKDGIYINDEFRPNSNPLIGKVPEVDGLKPGMTEKAGYSLVWTFKFNGKRLIGVNLGFPTKELRDMCTTDFVKEALWAVSIK